MQTAASTAGTNGHAVAVEVDGARYPSARSAARALGLSSNTVVGRCHSPAFPGYVWLGATPAKRELGPEDRRIGREIAEPERWPDDGGARRAPVMDTNFDPPRLVRRVGWLRCLCCGRQHFSPDVARVRLCWECKTDGSDARQGARVL